jgi:hypothetical protein
MALLIKILFKKIRVEFTFKAFRSTVMKKKHQISRKYSLKLFVEELNLKNE